LPDWIWWQTVQLTPSIARGSLRPSAIAYDPTPEKIASVLAIGMWHVVHLSSIIDCSVGNTETSASTFACQIGSVAALAMTDERHSEIGEISEPAPSRIAPVGSEDAE
jgi:hypothetical protein